MTAHTKNSAHLTTGTATSVSGAEPLTKMALDGWRQIISERLYGVDIHSKSDRFSASLHQTSLGPCQLFTLQADQQTVHWSRRRVKCCDPRSHLDLLHVTSGSVQVQQNGIDSELRDGDCIIVSRASPYEAANEIMTGALLTLPLPWLNTRIPDPEALIGKRINGRVGWGLALNTVLAQLQVEAFTSLPVPPSNMADQIATLVALSIRSDRSSLTLPSARLLRRIRAKLNELAYEPGLNPVSLARSSGISVRYLHKLFAAAGSSFGHELMERRLMMARAMLADHMFDQLTIAEIAYRSGFAEQGHFSKRFRLRFGCSPSSARRVVH